MKTEAILCAVLTLGAIAALAWWVLHMMGHRIRNIGNANPPFHS